MEKKMNWEKLLCSDRIHTQDSKKGQEKSSRAKLDPRNEFEKDVHRIFFSYPFRRLQNKTQVVPVPVFDFIHTRLTHSLEVASVGQVIGRIVGKKIIKGNKLEGLFTEYDIGAIVQAACLAHDIGNPPFGHSGEGAISGFFEREDNRLAYAPFFIKAKTKRYKKFKIPELTKKHWNDFVPFEGNAMGFRTINNPHYRGFNLTYATLAAFTKYPRESYINPKLDDPILKGKKLVPDPQNKDNTHRASQKKYGFFQAERDKFIDVANKVGLIELGNDKNLSWCRHPLAFLVEAVDDICYRLIDFEDGYRFGRIHFSYAEEILNNIAEIISIDTHTVYTKLDKKEKIGYLRGKAIFKLVWQIASEFNKNEDKMLKGEYVSVLSEKIEHAEILNEIKETIEKAVYNYTPILELEAVGAQVLEGLMELFIYSVTNNPKMAQDHRIKVLKLIPNQFLLTSKEAESPDNIYIKILKIIDYVAGMTDTYATQLYRRLKGIEIPHLQNLNTEWDS